MPKPSPSRQFSEFLGKYNADIQKTARAVLAKMRKRSPGTIEMVYDNYNGLVIGFGPTERPSEAIFSIILLPRWVTLCFLQGAKLRDPQRRLSGSGNQVRHIRLENAGTLDEPAIMELMDQALMNGKPFTESKRRLIIKSISPKQRPRRPKL